MGARASYVVGLQDRTTMTYGVTLMRDQFFPENLGRTNLRPSVEWKRKGDNGMTRITAYLQRTTYDGADSATHTDHTGLGANLIHHHYLSPGTTLVGALRVRKRKYDGEATAREPDSSLSLGAIQSMPGDSRLTYGLGLLNRRNPKKDHNRYLGTSLFARYETPVSGSTYLGLSARIGERDYRTADPGVGITRRDRYWEIGISLSGFRIKNLPGMPKISCHYTRTRSNIAANDRGSGYCAALVEHRY